MKRQKKTSNLLWLLLLMIALTGISFLSIFIFGKSCTLEMEVHDPEHVTVEYDETIVECVSQQVKNQTLTLDFHGVQTGNTFVTVREQDTILAEKVLYVHISGIMTIDYYFGKCRGDIMFSVSAVLILLTALLMARRKYQSNLKKSMYLYTNILLTGVIIFLTFVLIQQLLGIIWFGFSEENRSIVASLEQITLWGRTFSIWLLPFAMLISVIISISNLILMKREGIKFHNMLGLLLGFSICAGTLAPFFVYPLLDFLGVNVHNQDSVLFLIENTLEDIIAVFTAYLECILLGTVILGVKAAKHVPAFNKDYILILGCQITKDGKLTKLLQSRTDRAVTFAQMQKKATGKDLIFVPSGGKGNDEIIPEAEAIHNYLISIGIPEEQILVENQSANTEQNLKFSYRLIRKQKKHAKIAFSTTNYHVFRAGCLAQSMKIPMEGIGAKTKTYFWINAFIREFVAVLNSEKKHHAKMLCAIILALLPVECLIYFSYII
ncbi:MAG: YdcF family protein [Oscillospiraceae bacterium]|nr:YdcF family protein [Oscillospiraceae bacterium]